MKSSNQTIVPPSEPFSFRTRQANLETMAQKEFDLLIVGGGINGVWMALDAALRGYQVALVEAGDFGHGPSRNNSELLHGGFRYLKEWYQNPSNWLKVRSVLHLVRHALREREVLMNIAPHLARPVPFCMPLFAPKGLGWAKKTFYGFGFWMYDLLSAAQTIQPFSMLSKKQTIQKLNGIKTKNLTGSGIYYDCKMEPGRLIAEIVKAAHAQGVLLANYTKAMQPIWDEEKKTILGFACCDLLTQKEHIVRAKQIVDATGPWGDKFRKQVWPDAKPSLRLSKGIHIMVPQMFADKNACAFFSDDNRILFIIPWGEEYRFSLIGTTDTDYSEDPDAVAPDTESINYLTEKVRNLFPNVDLSCKGNYAGIRPLIRQEGGSASSVSREHTIQKHGETHVTSVFGGKWTTARDVALEVLDKIFPETKGQSKTRHLRFGGKDTAALIKEGRPIADEHLKHSAKDLGITNETLNHLIFSYGRNAEKVMEIAKETPESKNPILPQMPFIQAEILYAMRYEMAIRVADFLIRRSIFGRLRQRGLDAAPVVAKIMGQEMNWDEDKQKEEIEFFDRSTQIIEN